MSDCTITYSYNEEATRLDMRREPSPIAMALSVGGFAVNRPR
uniref:Uncharacterized protein n=1 Tax=Ralstonia solanacearum CFBP2957 TaxID=859656 RepID=D8P2Z4_RALSL|nr:protein of unknown function [Ralstonia solanacearum CFBP2957]